MPTKNNKASPDMAAPLSRMNYLKIILRKIIIFLASNRPMKFVFLLSYLYTVVSSSF